MDEDDEIPVASTIVIFLYIQSSTGLFVSWSALVNSSRDFDPNRTVSLFYEGINLFSICCFGILICHTGSCLTNISVQSIEYSEWPGVIL